MFGRAMPMPGQVGPSYDPMKLPVETPDLGPVPARSGLTS